MKIAIPSSNKQVVLIGMLFAAPLLFAASVYFFTAHDKVPGAAEQGFTGGLLIALALFAAATCASMLARRTVELGADAIVVRHSFYTLRLQRGELHAPAVSRVDDVRSLGITIKTNGIAAFGFYSGWFNSAHGGKLFLAISGAPVVVLRFTGHPRCAGLAMTGGAALEADLAAWLGQSKGQGQGQPGRAG